MIYYHPLMRLNFCKQRVAKILVELMKLKFQKQSEQPEGHTLKLASCSETQISETKRTEIC